MGTPKRLIACACLLCLAVGHCAALAAEPKPFSDAWLRDKGLLNLRYERNRWEDLKSLEKVIKGFRRSGLVVVWQGEDGGRTKNHVFCRSRVTPATAPTLRALHAKLTSLGFRYMKGSPTVLAYTVPPADKKRIDRLVQDARKRINARLPGLIRGLRRSRTRGGTDTYHYPGSGFLCLSFDDLSVRMQHEMRSCGSSLLIHLPSLGYMVQVFGARQLKRKSGTVVGSYTDPRVLDLVKKEVSKLIRMDPRAKVTRFTRPGDGLPLAK